MSSRWLIRPGDTERFAIELAFEHDPDQGAASSPEMSASWGSFQLWVRGRNLCAHEELGERLDSVHWYLLPLLEWFVEQWDPLLHEQRLPRADIVGVDAGSALRQHTWPPQCLDDQDCESWLSDWQAWWQRHNIQAARNGGLFPDVVIRRRGHDIEVSWGPGGLARAPAHFRFLDGSGSALLPPLDIAEPLEEALEGAIDQLSAWLPESPRVRALAEAFGTLRQPTSRRLAWMAGLSQERWDRLRQGAVDRFSAAKQAVFSIFESGNHVLIVDGSCQAPIMFGSLSPTLGDEDLLAVAEHQIRSFAEPVVESALLQEMTNAATLAANPPYQQGYDLAVEAAERLGLEEAELPVDIEDILDGLGVRLGTIELADPEIRGLAFVSTQHEPTILVNETYPANRRRTGRRFTLAHELCHILHDRSRGRAMALASGPWTALGIEQRANAFAAMLLMPPGHIRSLLATFGKERSRETIRAVADRLETGFIATLEHLSNLKFLSAGQREAIDLEFEE